MLQLSQPSLGALLVCSVSLGKHKTGAQYAGNGQKLSIRIRRVAKNRKVRDIFLVHIPLEENEVSHAFCVLGNKIVTSRKNALSGRCGPDPRKLLL